MLMAVRMRMVVVAVPMVMVLRGRHEIGSIGQAQATLVDQRIQHHADVVAQTQGIGGVHAAHGAHAEEAHAAVGHAPPLVRHAVFIFEVELARGELVPQHDVGEARFGDEPIPLLVTAFGEVDRRQLVGAQRLDRGVHEHLVSQDVTAGEGNQWAAQGGGLGQHGIDGGRARPGIVARACNRHQASGGRLLKGCRLESHGDAAQVLQCAWNSQVTAVADRLGDEGAERGHAHGQGGGHTVE